MKKLYILFINFGIFNKILGIILRVFNLCIQKDNYVKIISAW